MDWDSEQDIPVAAPTDDSSVNKVIDFVYKAYFDRSPFALSDLTHQSGWAWDKTRKADKFGLKNVDISNDWIAADFRPHVKSKAPENA